MEELLNSDIVDTTLTEEITTNINELEDLRDIRLKGSFIRSRIKDHVLGEKPNKYFLNLENSNFIFKNIKELLLVNGENVTKPDEILEEMRIFYQSLYSYKSIKDLDNSKLSEFPNEFNTLNETEDERLSLDSEISEKELKCQVFGSGSNKSPGPDRYTNKFYKAFGTKIKNLSLELDEAFLS